MVVSLSFSPCSSPPPTPSPRKTKLYLCLFCQAICCQHLYSPIRINLGAGSQGLCADSKSWGSALIITIDSKRQNLNRYKRTQLIIWMRRQVMLGFTETNTQSEQWKKYFQEKKKWRSANSWQTKWHRPVRGFPVSIPCSPRDVFSDLYVYQHILLSHKSKPKRLNQHSHI